MKVMINRYLFDADRQGDEILLLFKNDADRLAVIKQLSDMPPAEGPRIYGMFPEGSGNEVAAAAFHDAIDAFSNSELVTSCDFGVTPNEQRDAVINEQTYVPPAMQAGSQIHEGILNGILGGITITSGKSGDKYKYPTFPISKQAEAFRQNHGTFAIYNFGLSSDDLSKIPQPFTAAQADATWDFKDNKIVNRDDKPAGYYKPVKISGTRQRFTKDFVLSKVPHSKRPIKHLNLDAFMLKNKFSLIEALEQSFEDYIFLMGTKDNCIYAGYDYGIIILEERLNKTDIVLRMYRMLKATINAQIESPTTQITTLVHSILTREFRIINLNEMEVEEENSPSKLYLEIQEKYLKSRQNEPLT